MIVRILGVVNRITIKIFKMKHATSLAMLMAVTIFAFCAPAVAHQIQQDTSPKKANKKTSKVTVASGITSSRPSATAEKAGKEIPRQIIRELAQERLITDTQHVTFRLDAKNFIVNGVKQPQSVAQRYKAKFLNQPDWIINYQLQAEPSGK